MPITISSSKHFRNYFTLLFFTLLLAACGGEESEVANNQGSESTETETINLSGTAMKGVIANGIVQVFPIEDQDGTWRVSSTPKGNAERTDINGQFRFNFPGKKSNQSVVVEITADERTTMKCDIPEGCLIKDSGTIAAFGERFNLDSNFSLRGVAINPKGQQINNTIITPLSHLAIARAESLDGGLNNANLENSYTYIEQISGLSNGSLMEAIPDLTRLDEYSGLSADSIETAILSASFLAIANETEWDNVGDVINQAASAVSVSGTVSAASSESADGIALEDLFYHSQIVVEGILSESSDPDIQESLTTIGDEITVAYAEVSSDTTTELEPIIISTQPSSISRTESTPASFSVAANGGGTISYQWRKDGQNIEGANGTTFQIANASAADAGVYDVIVSNSAESVTSLSALLTITIPEPENRAPIATDDFIGTNEDTEVAIDVLSNDSDPDEDSLVLTGASSTNGTVEITTDNTLTYTPERNFNGTAEIAYTISDGRGGADSGLVTVTVAAINDNPVALRDTATTAEDTPVSISVLENDIDIDSNSLQLVSANSPNGSITIIENRSLIFTPASNFNGTASISYLINDNDGGSATGEADIEVSPVNDNPLAENDYASTDEDSPVVVNVTSNDSDIDGDALSVSDVTTSSGSASIVSDSDIRFTPANDFSGTASIYYTVTDGNGASDEAILEINVNDTNDNPVAQNDAATTNEDTPVTLNVLDNDTDADGDTLSLSSANAINGSVSYVTGGSLTFTPDGDFNGTTSITYTVIDNNGGSDTGNVNITVTPVNDRPSAQNDFASMNEDSTLSVNVVLNDSDVDGDALTLTEASVDQGSVRIIDASNLEYTPASDFNGSVEVSYTIADTSGSSATGTAFLTVSPVNDSPVALGESATTDEDTAVVIDATANDTDIDGDSLSIVAAETSNGSLSIDGGSITYTPDTGFSGEDTISYTISDGQGGSASASINVTVNDSSRVVSVELDWDVPTTRVNGDALDLFEIDGYIISYGVSPDSLTNEIVVEGASNTLQVINDLTPDTYYFELATVDIYGLQSPNSETFSITLD